MFSRRVVLAGASLATAVAFGLVIPHSVRAAGPLKVGILIPGSKSDKGWMESAKLEAIKKDILSGKIKVLKG
jgi:basic membrane protein A and related proteins